MMTKHVWVFRTYEDGICEIFSSRAKATKHLERYLKFCVSGSEIIDHKDSLEIIEPDGCSTEIWISKWVVK